MTTDTSQYFGFTDPTTTQGEWNKLRFAIQQELSELNTSLPVQVTSVTGVGVNPVGFVSLKILVDQVTGNDMTIPHDVIANVPYVRIQGGSNAVIIDPEVGDIGMALFCSRDISAVKNTRQSAPPGSRRMYSFSDCAYLGGVLNGAPTQYIQFTAGGIIVHSPTSVKVEAPTAQLSSANVQLGNISGSLLRLIDERLVSLFNSHTHASAGAGIPNSPLTLAGVATTITKAN